MFNASDISGQLKLQSLKYTTLSKRAENCPVPPARICATRSGCSGGACERACECVQQTNLCDVNIAVTLNSG